MTSYRDELLAIMQADADEIEDALAALRRT